MTALRTIAHVTLKDLRLEVRSASILIAITTSSLLTVIIFRFVVPDGSAALTAAIIWVGIVFAAVAGFSRSVAVEQDNGVLAILAIAPTSAEIIVLGKALANFIISAAVLLILMGAVFFFFAISHFDWALVGVYLLALAGLSLVGTLFAFVTAQLQTSRQFILTILLVPLATPLLFATVSIADIIIGTREVGGIVSWLPMIIIFDLIALISVLLTSKYAITQI